jgi:hypothetical protein
MLVKFTHSLFQLLLPYNNHISCLIESWLHFFIYNVFLLRLRDEDWINILWSISMKWILLFNCFMCFFFLLWYFAMKLIVRKHIYIKRTQSDTDSRFFYSNFSVCSIQTFIILSDYIHWLLFINLIFGGCKDYIHFINFSRRTITSWYNIGVFVTYY